MSDLSSAHAIQVGDKMLNVPTEHQYKSDIANEVSFYSYRRLTPLSEPLREPLKAALKQAGLL